MFKKFRMIMSVLMLMGLSAGQAVAVSTVQLDPSNPIFTAGSPTLDVLLTGTFDVAVDAGDFTVNWNPLVLEYTGTVIADPPWDTNIVDASDAATGMLNFIILGNSGTPLSVFDIGTISFNVIGNDGDFSEIAMADAFSGWSAPGAVNVPVTYVDGQVTVSPVPVPAAVWLMMSGLLGLVGVARRRS